MWTLVRFKTSNLFSLSDTQLMKTVPGSFGTCFIVLSIVIELNLNASDEKMCTNATTLVNSIVKTCLL